MPTRSEVPQEIQAAIRKEAFQQVSKWVVGAFAAGIGLAILGWWALLKPWLVSELGGAPKGAVIAVDGREKCPDPWVEYTDLRGRVVIGADGDNLRVGKSGGNSTITLHVDQLPPHEHPIAAVLTAEALGARRGWTDNDGGWWLGRVWLRPSDNTDNTREPDTSLKGTRKTEVQGGPAKPIEILPPYFVLRYCIRAE